MNYDLVFCYIVSFALSAIIWPPVYLKLEGFSPDNANRTWIGLVSVLPILNSMSAALAVAILLGYSIKKDSK
jgi:hypothetical protein